MGRKKDILDKLAERLANGEISESTYLAIKERYDREGFPDEDEDEPDVREIRIKIPSFPQISIPDFQGAAPMVYRGDYKGEEYRVTGVGKVAGNCECKTADILGVCKITGSFSGEAFRVTGTCKVAGDIETKDLKVSGIVKVGGRVSAEGFVNSGTMKVGGSVESKEFTTSGLLKVGGDVEVASFENSGTAKVGGHVRAEEGIVQSGVLKVGDSIQGKAFRSSGVFRVHGPIRAETIEIDLSGDSRAGLLEASDIKITARVGGGSLGCETIRGRSVYIEATTADLVEGDDVEIGPRCRVVKVVAKNLKAHETAKIESREVGKGEEEG